jgi:REP element-mobilizing transposase RayT
VKQLTLLKRQKSAYGGELMTTRKGRAAPRPLSTKDTMHLVLRSSKARGPWSFRQQKNAQKIRALTAKFAAKYGVKVLHAANVGNHLHFHVKLGNRHTYTPFIRALTAAIAMAVTGASRWAPLKKSAKDRFWDYRPFTRIVQSYRALLNLRDYLFINQLEGQNRGRAEARVLVGLDWGHNSRSG